MQTSILLLSHFLFFVFFLEHIRVTASSWNTTNLVHSHRNSIQFCDCLPAGVSLFLTISIRSVPTTAQKPGQDVYTPQYPSFYQLEYPGFSKPALGVIQMCNSGQGTHVLIMRMCCQIRLTSVRMTTVGSHFTFNSVIHLTS